MGICITLIVVNLFISMSKNGKSVQQFPKMSMVVVWIYPRNCIISRDILKIKRKI